MFIFNVDTCLSRMIRLCCCCFVFLQEFDPLLLYIQNLLEEARNRLGQVTRDPSKYKKVLEGLITQVIIRKFLSLIEYLPKCVEVVFWFYLFNIFYSTHNEVSYRISIYQWKYTLNKDEFFFVQILLYCPYTYIYMFRCFKFKIFGEIVFFLKK